MSELFQNLGIDWRILLAQIINFAILLFLLKKFAYKPIMRALDARRKRIEENIERSRQVEEKMREIETLKEQVLREARAESEAIIKKAEEAARRVQEQIFRETHARSERVFMEAQKKIESEREKIFGETKREIANLVVLSVERSVGDVLDKHAQQKLVDQALSLIAKQ